VTSNESGIEGRERSRGVGAPALAVKAARAGAARAVLIGLALACAGSCGSEGRAPVLAQPGGGGGAGGGAGVTGLSGSPGSGGSAIANAGGAAGSGQAQSCIPREECQRLCAVLDGDGACGLGSASQCGCNCEERFNGPCPDELDELLGCVGEAPSIDCSERGRVFAGCENESVALDLCDFQARGQLCAEAFPPCTPYCRGALLATCTLGPESVSSCLCGCEQSYATRCAAEFEAFMSCTSNEPAFACDSAGRVVAAVCEPEWQALDVCSRAPVAADAG
jgi:hypothetical protein